MAKLLQCPWAMKTARSWILPFFLLVSSSSLAADFQQDFDQLKYATRIANIQTRDLEKYLDPTQGPISFRLSDRRAPWAGNYFPMKEGGIANRWQVGEFPKKTLSKRQVKRLSEQDLKSLSPIEKYDLLVGDYDFKATNFELSNRGPLRNPPAEEWEGFCNGVRCAGFLLPEPHFPVQVTNADGLRIEFQPTDLKALAGASYFYVEKYAGLGAPSRNAAVGENQPNPAIFDMALRYNLGVRRKAFVVDSNLTSEIWNETVVGYERELGPEIAIRAKEKRAYPDAVTKRVVNLRLETLGEIDASASNKPTRGSVASGEHLQEIRATYSLYLDSDGRAVGGVWHKTSEDRGIDFAWFAAGKGADGDHGWNSFLDFKTIRHLFKESARPVCSRALL